MVAGSVDEKMWGLIKDKEAAASLALDGRLFEQEEQAIDLQKFLDDLKEDWQEDRVTVDEEEVEDRLDALMTGCPTRGNPQRTHCGLNPQITERRKANERVHVR